MAVSFLVDANLPSKIALFHSEQFAFARDLGIEQSDEAIWAYAREQGLTILTRDFDFYRFISMRGFPPSVIWIRMHRVKIDRMRTLLTQNWKEILKLVEDFALVEVFPDQILGSFPKKL